jgi:hypothetical protein
MRIGTTSAFRPKVPNSRLCLPKIALDGDPPIGGGAVERAFARGVDAERSLRGFRQIAVGRQLGVEGVVEKAVGAKADEVLRQRPVDQRARDRLRRQFGGDVRKAPGWRRVPYILDARIVVEREAPEEVVATQLDAVRKANVGVVPAEAPGSAIVGRLDEGAGMVGQSPAGEEARLLQREIIVRAEMRRRTLRLRRLGMREGRLQEHRERRQIGLAAAERIAAELEPAAERRQLRKGGTTARAGQPGLPRIKRQRKGRARRDGRRERRD